MPKEEAEVVESVEEEEEEEEVVVVVVVHLRYLWVGEDRQG